MPAAVVLLQPLYEPSFEDEFVGMIASYAASPGGAGAVKVLIANRDLDQARRIVEDFVKDSKA
jgi:hypothetical protein